MKNHWKMSVKRRFGARAGALLVALFLPWVVKAAPTPAPEDLDTLSFIEMIHTVDLGDQSKFIQQFQEKEARAKLLSKFDSDDARKDGFSVETYRNKEILVVTIPAHRLFAPNDTALMSQASDILSTFKRYFKNPDTYRVLLLMHTDNTGSELYRDKITEQRVDAVFDWFEDQGCDTSYLFSYAMGDEWPMFENNSQENRKANRRLEIYLMPGNRMLEMAKKGKIEF